MPAYQQYLVSVHEPDDVHDGHHDGQLHGVHQPVHYFFDWKGKYREDFFRLDH